MPVAIGGVMRALHRAVVAMIVVVSTAVVATQVQFPDTRSRGRSTVEFYDKQVRIVASYDYSQREHDTRWLLIQLAMSSKKPMTIERSGIALRAPDGKEIPMATQERVGENTVAVQQLLQNAVTRRHDTASYFSQRDRVEALRLFRLPFGHVVHTNVVVDNDHV